MLNPLDALRLWPLALVCALGGCDDATSPDTPLETLDAAAMADAGPDAGARPDATADPGRDAALADVGPAPDSAGLDLGADAEPTDGGGALDLGADAVWADAATDAEAPDAGPAPRVFQDEYAIDAAFTEGGIYDPTGHAFFVGSLQSGGVYRIDASTGAQTTLFTPEGPSVWWTLGMDVDVVANRLYVCAMDDRRALDEDHDYVGYLWGFDLESGERVVDHDLRDSGEGATCTDVAVADDGTVYVNDRENPRVYVYDPSRGDLALLVEDDALAGGLVGQNALLVLPDQSGLLSLVYLPSRLVHISLPAGVITEVEIEGDFFDGLPALSGADGMALDDNGSLLVAFTSQVNRVRPLGGWHRAVSSTVDVEGGLTDVVHAPGGLNYLLNGQSVTFALGREPAPSTLVRFDDDL